MFLCILYFFDQISAWVFLIYLFFYAGFYCITPAPVNTSCLFVCFFVLIKNMVKNLGSLFSQETPSILEPMEANLEKPRTMCPGFSVASLKSLGSVWLQTFEGDMIMYLFTSFYYPAELLWKPALRFNLIKYNYNFRKWVIIETSSLNLFSLCGLRDLQM